MKRLLAIFCTLICVAYPSMAQKDFIISRNGSITPVSIVRVNDKEVVYKESDKKRDPEFTVSNSEIYMLHFSKRGNVYLTEDGKRLTGEMQSVPRDADVIYTIDRREIIAYNIRVHEDIVTYNKDKKEKKYAGSEVLPRSNVFMIRYSDGTTDVINDITLAPSATVMAEIETTVSETPVEESAEEQLVIFHSVKRGETLAKISKRYNVTEQDIIKWNDLPSSIKSHSRLQPDMQLMIYVKPQ